jgi:hypothetical protein
MLLSQVRHSRRTPCNSARFRPDRAGVAFFRPNKAARDVCAGTPLPSAGGPSPTRRTEGFDGAANAVRIAEFVRKRSVALLHLVRADRGDDAQRGFAAAAATPVLDNNI